MKKVKGIIDRFEESVAVIRYDGEVIKIPKKILSEFKEGETVVMVFASSTEDTENSSQVAKSLLSEILKEEE